MNESNDKSISSEELEYYERCKQIYHELSNTKLLDSLNDLREQTINRVARVNTDREVWKELGKLHVIDMLIGKKTAVYNEIKRVETIIDGK